MICRALYSRIASLSAPLPLYQKCVANEMKRRLSVLSSSTAHVTLFSAPMLTWKKSSPESSSARRSFL